MLLVKCPPSSPAMRFHALELFPGNWRETKRDVSQLMWLSADFPKSLSNDPKTKAGTEAAPLVDSNKSSVPEKKRKRGWYPYTEEDGYVSDLDNEMSSIIPTPISARRVFENF